MNALTASVDDAAVDYVHQPVNFGPDDNGTRTAESDAFRAGAAWAVQNVDWRVLAGVIPGHMMADRMRLDDRVLIGDVSGRVTHLSGDHASVEFVVTTDEGAPIAFRRPRMGVVMVLDVGRAR